MVSFDGFKKAVAMAVIKKMVDFFAIILPLAYMLVSCGGGDNSKLAIDTVKQTLSAYSEGYDFEKYEALMKDYPFFQAYNEKNWALSPYGDDVKREDFPDFIWYDSSRVTYSTKLKVKDEDFLAFLLGRGGNILGRADFSDAYNIAQIGAYWLYSLEEHNGKLYFTDEERGKLIEISQKIVENIEGSITFDDVRVSLQFIVTNKKVDGEYLVSMRGTKVFSNVEITGNDGNKTAYSDVAFYLMPPEMQREDYIFYFKMPFCDDEEWMLRTKDIDENGFNRAGVNSEGYNREGFDEFGYNKEGFDRSGFNKEGYDREGYNGGGFNRDGIDREGYGKDGFNTSGYNREGYDREGYNSKGVDRYNYTKDRYLQNQRRGRGPQSPFDYDRNEWDGSGNNLN